MNAADCGALTALFPLPTSSIPTLADKPGGIAVQAVPVLATTVVWLGVVTGRRRPATRFVQRVAGAVALVSITALGLIAWHILAILECEEKLGAAHAWTAVIVIGVSLANVLVLGVVVRYTPLSVGLSYLGAAAGAVSADWALRGGITESLSAYRFVAMQQVLSILALCSVYALPAPRKPLVRSAPRASKDTRRVRWLDATDALARRENATDACAVGDRPRSWFHV